MNIIDRPRARKSLFRHGKNVVVAHRHGLAMVVGLLLPGYALMGQAIFSNPITGTNPNTSDPYTNGQSVGAGITVSGIGRGAGIAGTNANDRYNANSWNTTGIDPTAYFYWTITPSPGQAVDFTSLVYTAQRSGTGPSSFAFRSSVDGFTADIGSPSGTGATINLSGAEYQGISGPITFRLYGWNTTNSGGTFSVNDFTFNGEVVAELPGPAATIAQHTGGMAASPLLAGTADHVLFGFSAVSDAASGVTDPATQSITSLTVQTSSNTNGVLSNVRLVRSLDDDPATAGDNTVVGVFDQNVGAISLGPIAEPLGPAVRYYFVVADVEGSVTPATPTVQCSLSDAGCTMSAGDVNSFSFSGTEYAFIGSGSPVLSATPVDAFGEVCINTDLPGTATFTLTGADLTASDVTVGPLAGFAFYDPFWFDYVPSLTFVHGGSLSETITVRFLPTLVQSYDGEIPVNGGGASTTVAVSGTGVNTLPTVATGAVSGSLTTGTAAGSVTDQGCTGLSGVGAEYSTEDGFAPGSGTQVPATAPDFNWSVDLTDLDPCTTYYVRAYATNDGGTAYGDQSSFTTSGPEATVATAATGIFSTGFTATWEEVPGAAGYLLDVSTMPTFAVEAYANDLIISEYLEGSSSNKYLEIYNGTANTVNLGLYQLVLFSNGGPATTTTALSGSLPSGSTAVYRNGAAALTLPEGVTETTAGAVNFNGNDAIALQRIAGGVHVDIFGNIFENPSTWSSGAHNTTDRTLVRKSTVVNGITVDPASGFPTLVSEWDVFPVNTVADLGTHTCVVPSVTPSFVPGYEALPVSGGSHEVTGLTLGVTYYYRVRVLMGTGCESPNSNAVSVVTACDPVTIGPVTSNAPICSSEDLSLSVVVTGGEGVPTFAWSGSGTFDPTDASDVMVSGASTGTYTVTVENGCSSVQGVVSVDVEQATAWYADTDTDGLGDPLDMLEACEQPEGYVANSDDECPTLEGTNGDVCDAGPGFVLGAIEDCACVGQVCTTDLVLETWVPGEATLPTWEARERTTGILVASGGGGLADNEGHYPVPFCLPDGDFYFVVDGVPAGANYQLHNAVAPFERIIENIAPVAGPHQVTLSGVSGGTIQLPMSDERLLFLNCDKYWWKNGEFIVANEDPAVAALWNNGNPAQQANTGYDFWFYDPNGTYSFIKSRRHNTSDGYGTGSARACHAKVNGWSGNQIPESLPLNVRVRAVVDGDPGNWGAACRFTLDTELANCPPTTLIQIPGHQFYSCNVQRQNTTHNTQRIYAQPVSGATQYRFTFSSGEGVFSQVRNTYYLNLGWTTGTTLQLGAVYNVTVEAFKNGSWCPAGEACSLEIIGGGMVGGSQNSGAAEQGGADEHTTGTLRLWPNPNNGVELRLQLDGVEAMSGTIAVEIHDLSGKRIMAQQLPARSGAMVVGLQSELAGGTYVAVITVGETRFTERLVIQR